MSGEGRPVMRIPSIFDSDDDSEEETRSPMTFRALTTTTTNTTTTTGASVTTAKPISESQSEPPPSAPQETKEPQSLSSNSESDGETFSPKPEAKLVKPLDSPHVQSSSDDSDDSEDEGGGKDLVFSSKEEKLEDEEDEEVEEEDATLVANEDDINISHSSPENQDGSDDEDDDDSSNSDDEDDDESDDEQDRSGSSVEYEGTMLSQEGGSHVVYSPATPLSIKITTARKGEFAIRQETPSSKSPFQVESEGDTEEENGSECQEKRPSAVNKKEILQKPEDKKDSEGIMELAETRKAEETEVIHKDKAEDMEENKDEEDMEISKSSPSHEKTVEKNENKKVCDLLNSEAEDKNSSMKFKEEKLMFSEQKEDKEKEPVDTHEVEDIEGTKEEALDKEITKAKTSNKSESEPMETTVREDRTSSRSEVIEPRGKIDGSDSGALEIESPEAQELETDKYMKENEDKEDEPMEVEEEKDMVSKEELNESNGSDMQEPVEEVRGEKEEEEEEEEEVIEKAPVNTVTTFRKEEKEEEEEIGRAPVNKVTTFRKEEKEEEEEIGRAPADKVTTFRKEEKEDEETEEAPADAITRFRKEGKEEEEETEAPVDTITTFRKEEKEEEEEEEKSNEMQKETNKTDIPVHNENQDKEGYETHDTEEKLEMAVDDEDVEMKECPEEVEEEEEEEEKKKADRDSSKARGTSPPPPIPPPVSVILDSDTDSEATMDAEKAQDIITGASAKGTKVLLRVEDVYLDSEDDSHSLSKPLGEGGSENAAGNGEGGSQSTMTSETDSVDPEDQRDCLSQHSSSRASSTDLFIKVSSCSPRAESPSDTPTRSRQSARPKKSHTPTPADLASYMEAFKKGWRREIVLRAVQNPMKAGGARADIYYYAPSGKKLRSRVEIEDYLYRSGITDLTLNNFTWIKEPLGVSEEHEQIRHASAKSAGSAVAPARRKPTPGTPTSTGSTSPASTPHSSAPLYITQTPKTSPVVTITSITKTPPMVKIPTTIKAAPSSKSPSLSSAPSSSKASVVPLVPSVNMVSPGVVYSYDTTVPRKRGRGRPRKYTPEETPPKRARMKTTPVVPIMIKKGVGRGDVVSAPPPPPLPPPPTSVPATLPVSSGMQHLQHHTPPSHGVSMGVQRPVLPTPTPRPRQAARKTKDPVVTTGHITSLPPCPPKILTPMLMGGARHRTFHCTGTCPLGGGSVPCLQCVKCLCLFHPECTCMPPQTVTIIQAGAAKFLCPNCYRENKENVGSNKWVPPEPYEPLAHDPSSASSDSDDEDEAGGGQGENGVWVENYTQVCLRPDTPPTPPSSPSPSHSLGPWRGDMNDSRQEHPSEQAQQSSGPGEVSRSGPTLASLPPNTNMGGQLVQIQQPGSGTACFFLVQGRPGAPGGELVAVPGTGPMGVPKAMPPVILPRFSMEQQQQVPMAGPLIMQQQHQLFRSAVPLQMTPQELLPQQKQERPVGKHYKQYYERENSFLGELSQRYLLLRHVFKYLSVRDLLVASQVCLLWRDLALSPSLWETVRLRNVCVKDWSEFARFLDQRNIKNLDLRKMRLKENRITKKSSKSGMVQKLKAKGAPSTVQEASTSAQPLHKPSGDSVSRQDQKTLSHIDDKDRKKSQGDNENQEASSRKLHSQNSTDDTEPPKTQNKKSEHASESLSKELKDGEMEVDKNKQRGMEDASESQSSEDLGMECNEEKEESSSNKTEGGNLDPEETQEGKHKAEWQEIFTALSHVRCLRGITLPACPGHVLQLLLASCRHLTCINAMDLRHPSGPIRFDPAYLMETPDLTELRIGSPSGFSLTTNFNFIKLQKLRVLVMRGLSGDSWPYLGTNLTTLQVGPIKTFTTSTWANLGSMTNLQALWLEEGGSLSDSSICDGLSRLTSLRRLCLFNFVVGPKLGQALKKLPNLDRLFVLPVGTEEASIMSQNSNMLAVMEVLRYVEELVWAVHASDVYFSGGCDRIQMCPNEGKMYKGMTEKPESNLWSLPKLEMVLKRQLPHSNMRIVKLDPTAASHLSLATL